MSQTPSESAAARHAQLAAAWQRLQQRVAAACTAADVDPQAVRVIAVTKTFPAADVAHLRELGLVDFGESRVAELVEKASAAAASGPGATWHFVGQLQTNKVRDVARWADVVHSVDRARLVTALDRAATAAGRRIAVLAQVSLDADRGSGRGGVPPEELPELAARIAESKSLDLRGVMAISPRDPQQRPAAFDLLTGLVSQFRSNHPAATWLSAGMSGDLEEAVAAGATHLRVGRDLLGYRPPLG